MNGYPEHCPRHGRSVVQGGGIPPLLATYIARINHSVPHYLQPEFRQPSDRLYQKRTRNHHGYSPVQAHQSSLTAGKAQAQSQRGYARRYIHD
jgi:hypothetical protein